MARGERTPAALLAPMQPLSDWLGGRTPLPEVIACQIGVQLLEALSALHQKGIRHGGLSVDRVQVRAEDGGLAVEVGPPANGPFEGPMTPEARSGEGLGPWTDVFQVGVLLFEALSGERVPQGQVLEVERVATVPLWPEVAAVLRRALAAEVSMRYRDAEALEAALAMALDAGVPRDTAPALGLRRGVAPGHAPARSQEARPAAPLLPSVPQALAGPVDDAAAFTLQRVEPPPPRVTAEAPRQSVQDTPSVVLSPELSTPPSKPAEGLPTFSHWPMDLASNGGQGAVVEPASIRIDSGPSRRRPTWTPPRRRRSAPGWLFAAAVVLVSGALGWMFMADLNETAPPPPMEARKVSVEMISADEASAVWSSEQTSESRSIAATRDALDRCDCDAAAEHLQQVQSGARNALLNRWRLCVAPSKKQLCLKGAIVRR